MSFNDQEKIGVVSKYVQQMLESDQSIKINEDLVNRGLDSIKMISLVVALEKEFKIAFEDAELLIRNFSTIEKIVAKVKEKLEG